MKLKLTQAERTPLNILDSLMAAILVRLELASHVAAATTDGDKVSHGKNQGNEPPRVSPAHLHYARCYSHCYTDEAKRKVIGEALTELRSLRYSRRPSEQDTRERRIMIGMDPRGATTVAHVWGCSRQHVYRLRAEAKRLPYSVRQAVKV